MSNKRVESARRASRQEFCENNGIENFPYSTSQDDLAVIPFKAEVFKLSKATKTQSVELAGISSGVDAINPPPNAVTAIMACERPDLNPTAIAFAPAHAIDHLRHACSSFGVLQRREETPIVVLPLCLVLAGPGQQVHAAAV
ncbi:hypothetical protein [Rhizobium chutanense]|uniref:hypothetical protein n=1 Tax=Rhizobium chutanense TaxID=2035448 RepID=UPI00117A24F8|nr:hypothetical protein [Rhizobium chutanense]